ncbi:MAG: DASS family sodium-coupled anion symporter [Candidatus Bathyarchaeota archaeon]|nr:MAG: DASS family sodium-coupled anion symporter [Candidatus Bathyarchaeota archaeon]
MKGKGKGRENVAKIAVSLLTIGVFLWFSYTSRIQGQILGVVLFALVIWSLYPGRHLESSILVILVLTLFQASLSPQEFLDSLFSTYGGSGLWIIVSGFVLAKAMETSGLGRRIALWMATSLGGNPDNIVLSVAVANLAVAPLSPSTTAKAFLLHPICAGLVEAFNVEKGQSKYGTALMLMAMAANNICSTAFLTATVPNPISAQYIREATGLGLSWLGWATMALPLTLVLLAASWFICVRIFRPEVEESSESLGRMRGLRAELGPMSRGEKLVTTFFAIALMLWITDGFHSLNSGIISLALSLILFAPRIGVMKMEGFAGDVPWGSISLFAASMFLANAVGKWRALDPIAHSVFDVLNLSSLDSILFLFLVVLVSMLLHLAFTSTTVYATVMVPLVISLAQLQGSGVASIALPVAYLAPVAVILPVNTIPNIVFYSSGYFNHRQMLVYGLTISFISVILVLSLGLPYWKLLGLV